MEKNEAQLIAEYLSGNEEAITSLVRLHLKPVYNFIYRLVGNAEEAEDITQDTFFKLWKNLKKYRPEENFKTWLFAIARNTAIDYLRKKKHLLFSDFENESGENVLENNLTDEEPLADEVFGRLQDKERVEKALQILPAPQREVVLLHYMEYLTFDEIGKILKEPLNTVKSRHQRALLTLRKILDAPKENALP